MVAVGDNPDRLRSEASFAMMCGVCPIPASSGKTQRHRLKPRRQPPSQLRPAHGRRVPNANRRADPSLCRSQDPGGAVQTRDHALPEALRGPRDRPRTHRPIECLTNMRASAVSNICRSNTPGAWSKPGSILRLAASATATTTRWPERSTASTRPRRSTGAARGRSFEAVEYATLEWVDWFNNHRLLGPIGNIPPAEAEANHYAASENLDMAA